LLGALTATAIIFGTYDPVDRRYLSGGLF